MKCNPGDCRGAEQGAGEEEVGESEAEGQDRDPGGDIGLHIHRNIHIPHYIRVYNYIWY